MFPLFDLFNIVMFVLSKSIILHRSVYFSECIHIIKSYTRAVIVNQVSVEP